jgi:hypothetical protein
MSENISKMCDRQDDSQGEVKWVLEKEDKGEFLILNIDHLIYRQSGLFLVDGN